MISFFFLLFEFTNFMLHELKNNAIMPDIGIVTSFSTFATRVYVILCFSKEHHQIFESSNFDSLCRGILKFLRSSI